MNHRLKLSKTTLEIFQQLQASTNITPNVLARIAVALSLKNEQIPKVNTKEISNFEISRATLTGEHDFSYKSMILQHANQAIEEEHYFPDLFNAHIDRGADELFKIYQYSGNPQKFWMKILEIE
ncbi:DndE family protein [Exiguobacterium sp. RIT594]|uniref:DndE family protein n=1 Tax=Exiguobacterium sp. RIT594 TaxID=2282449 RepID=UPI000DF7C99C|nr:DndE family protein [Exiguobacterium sp. RIT594]RDB32482.1 DUF1832 domain-containing protein [Exiguobacterium sp. RIT594]